MLDILLAVGSVIGSLNMKCFTFTGVYLKPQKGFQVLACDKALLRSLKGQPGNPNDFKRVAQVAHEKQDFISMGLSQ